MPSSFGRDLRLAYRLLRNRPRDTCISVAILALGIGANTAMFSAVNHVLWRPFPFRDEARLVRLREQLTASDGTVHPYNMSSRAIVTMREEARDVFETIVAMSGQNMSLAGSEAPERVSVVLQTDGFDETLGVQPVLGRGLTRDELQRGIDSGVALVSHALWETRFGGSSSALGSTVRLDDRSFTLVGVMPPQYAFPLRRAILGAVAPRRRRRQPRFRGVGAHARGSDAGADRRRDDACRRAHSPRSHRSLRRLRHRSAHHAREPARQPGRAARGRHRDRRLHAVDRRRQRGDAATGARRLSRARVRGPRRNRPEPGAADRAAAGRERGARVDRMPGRPAARGVARAADGVVRAEGVERAAWAGDAAHRLARCAVRGRGIVDERRRRRRAAGRRDAAHRSAGGACRRPRGGGRPGGTIVPRRADRRRNRADARSARGRRRRHSQLRAAADGGARLRRARFACRRADAAAGRLRDRRQTDRADSPRARGSVGRARCHPRGGDVGEPAGRRDLGRRDRVRRHGGARSARVLNVNHRLITPGLFDTMGTPIVRGRAFTAQDRDGAQPVVIVSSLLARRLWPGRDAVGRRVRLARANSPWLTVVGVAADVSDSHEPGVPRETWYVPYAQHADTAAAEHVYVMGRAGANPLSLVADVRRAIARVDRTLAPYGFVAMDQYRTESLARERASAAFMTGFGAFGVLLAALGVYGVMALSVAERTTEFGIRIALGARAADILPLVMRRALALVSAGLGIGAVAAAALTRFLASVLTSSAAVDPLMVAVAAALMLLTAFIACLVPTLAAGRLDPAIALKYE